MWGTIVGSVFTSSSFMAVQTTGAMSIIVADVDAVSGSDDPAAAVFTLSVLTGAVMLAAGLLKLGSLLSYVSTSVMTGFISAVGVNIVLGQLDGFTGYAAEGSNRIARTIDLLLHPLQVDIQTLVVGAATVVLILTLGRTPLGPLGMVVAVFAASALVPLFGWDIDRLNDVADIPNSLPLPKLPDIGLVPALIVPAASLAFVGLVQGAGVSAAFTNPDGTQPDASSDFVGQGAANVAAGALMGMPVGGSMSASALAVSAGARSRRALLIAGVVMVVVVLVLAEPVGFIAMPALAGLLITIGVSTIKPDRIAAVAKTGRVQQTVLIVTFVLTMLIPLQYAVLLGVALSIMLYVIRQSNQISVSQLVIDDEGHLLDADPPAELSANSVVMLEPVGSLFFAAAPTFEALLPEVTDRSENAVVILRLRGRDDIGATLVGVLVRYAGALTAVGGKLLLASVQPGLRRQLDAAADSAAIGPADIYGPGRWRSDTLLHAYADAQEWVAAHDDTKQPPPADS